MTEDQKRQALLWIVEGLTLETIAQRLGLDPETVREYLLRG